MVFLGLFQSFFVFFSKVFEGVSVAGSGVCLEFLCSYSFYGFPPFFRGRLKKKKKTLRSFHCGLVEVSSQERHLLGVTSC